MSQSGFLTIGDDYPRKNYEHAAYKVANERDGPWHRAALFQTPHGLLMLEWGRYGWDARWLEEPKLLDLGKITDDTPAETEEPSNAKT